MSRRVKALMLWVWRVGAGLVFLVGLCLATAAVEVMTAPTPAKAFTIPTCRTTGSATQPYAKAEMRVDSSGRIKAGAADIVPPYTHAGYAFPGQNWNASDAGIWANGCVTGDSPAVQPPPPAPDPIPVQERFAVVVASMGFLVMGLAVITMTRRA